MRPLYKQPSYLKNLLFLILCILAYSTFHAAADTPPDQIINVSSTITGQVLDRDTGKPVEGASIFIGYTTIGVETDTEGRFRLTDIPPGGYDVRARCGSPHRHPR